MADNYNPTGTGAMYFTDMFYTVKDFMEDNNLTSKNPVFVFALAFATRSVLQLFMGEVAVMSTIAVGLATWYAIMGFNNESEDSIHGAKVETEALGRRFQNAKDAQNALRRPVDSHRKPTLPPFETEEEKKRRNPELYSIMDEVDGKIIPPRRKQRGKRLYEGRRKGKQKQREEE